MIATFTTSNNCPKKKGTYPKDNNPMDPKLEKKVPSVYHGTLQLLHMSVE